MDTRIDAFLARWSPVATDDVTWGPWMRIRATVYLTQEAPPLPYVTSVRAVVLRAGEVLVQQDRDSRHILPGGRREGDETLELALRREVSEETGWSLDGLRPLGCTHFRHLDPKPPGYAYPYPDFFHRVYAASAMAYLPETRLDDGYEVGSEFLPITTVRQLSLSPPERVYLDAALRVRRDRE